MYDLQLTVYLLGLARQLQAGPLFVRGWLTPSGAWRACPLPAENHRESVSDGRRDWQPPSGLGQSRACLRRSLRPWLSGLANSSKTTSDSDSEGGTRTWNFGEGSRLLM
eukprot:1120081-Rhodomonas_salina.1